MEPNKREKFSSSLGFLLVSAGCAIGVGNIWKFPYLVGTNGGGIFVLFYLLFLAIMGIPVLTMELAVGRGGRNSAVCAYKALEPKGSKWHIHGWFCLAGSVLLVIFYTTISGWFSDFCWKYIVGAFKGLTPDAASVVIADVMGSGKECVLWMAITVIAGFIVVSFGLKKGLEKVTKWMMTGLLILILVLAVHSLTLPNANKGVAFYLVPDFARASARGWGNIIVDAMNQSFFTLSLGIACIQIFGSYMSREHTLTKEAVRICVLDTFAAIMAGLIIFPACFSYGIEPDAGPNLIFMTLPRVFQNMAGGRVWGALFFLFMTFASFSTIIAVFENIMAIIVDSFGWSRRKTALIIGSAILVLSIPCALGFNVWSHVSPFRGLDIQGAEDFIVSNLLLPIGCIVYLLFCVTKWGWGYDNYLAEVNTGDGVKLGDSKLLKGYFRFVLPVLIIVILILGL